MNKRLDIEPDLMRRLFLRQSANAARMLLVAALVLPASRSFADDGESESDGESDSDSDGESDSDSDGESGDGGHGGDSGNDGGNDGHDNDNDNDNDSGGFDRGPLDQSDATRAVSQGDAISLKSALHRVEGAYGGAVIDVTLHSTGRRLEYSFKVRTDRGAVRTVRMDAKSGRFLGLGSLFR